VVREHTLIPILLNLVFFFFFFNSSDVMCLDSCSVGRALENYLYSAAGDGVFYKCQFDPVGQWNC
jgi:hypothetical protein